MKRMTIDHLKQCQAIAEKTGGKELASALARAIANRTRCACVREAK